jgi:enolase-phosphatase E1
MIEFAGKLLLLDIEGTVSDIAFVRDVLFPYAARHVRPFLVERWESIDVIEARNQMAVDAGRGCFDEWCPSSIHRELSIDWLTHRVQELIQADSKTTGLKALQGRIWGKGYHEGLLQSHLYPDVTRALKDWRAQDRQIAIYSSGSVAAQKLFFSHTIDGDLTPLISGYYDTRVGPKRSPGSFKVIADDRKLTPPEVLFLSDIPEELDAAAETGMRTGLVERPGNRPVLTTTHGRIQTLESVRLTRST